MTSENGLSPTNGALSALNSEPFETSQFETRSGRQLSYSREQASRFAKQIAGDFNPLHDTDAKRFCVPGDLLFVTLLREYGVAHHTHVEFSNMVDDQMMFELPEHVEDNFELVDSKGKSCLTMKLQGARETNTAFVAALTESYVRFSGQTFPDILVSLMQANNVMINPGRPLVIYKSMQVKLVDGAVESFATRSEQELQLDLVSSTMDIDGKKATALLEFQLSMAGIQLGHGSKVMLLGGLRAYDQHAIDDIVEQYNSWKERYVAPA